MFNKDALYFVCYLIEGLSRATRNTKNDLIKYIDLTYLKHIYEFHDVYHCLPYDHLIGEQQEKLHIRPGRFNAEKRCNYKVPTVSSIARVYNRVLLKLTDEQDNIDILLTKLIEMYNSPICNKVDDFNTAMYYSPTEYIAECFKQGKVFDDGL